MQRPRRQSGTWARWAPHARPHARRIACRALRRISRASPVGSPCSPPRSRPGRSASTRGPMTGATARASTMYRRSAPKPSAARTCRALAPTIPRPGPLARASRPRAFPACALAPAPRRRPSGPRRPPPRRGRPQRRQRGTTRHRAATRHPLRRHCRRQQAMPPSARPTPGALASTWVARRAVARPWSATRRPATSACASPASARTRRGRA
mmetsp:Transcript_19231/g.55854  ORF Transcript_19231/g.55854 Transcript_19231/m.55854 type:complete len:210 (+) Transcript_19231:40-669(+)